METDSGFADWQVKQAADAILLYADKYLQSKPSLLTLYCIFSFLEDPYFLMAQLLYGSGLHLLGCMRLRVKDIYFANNLIIIRCHFFGWRYWILKEPNIRLAI